MTSKRKILSDDDSSDSSNEFLVPAHKIDLTSSFFEKSKKKSSPQKKGNVGKNLADSSSENDDFEECEDQQISSTELLAQVMKNLENAKNQNLTGSNSESNDNAAGQSLSGESLKSKEQLLSQEINSLLLQGESQASTSQVDSAEEAGDNEEAAASEEKYSIPQEGVKIHLPGQNIIIDSKGSRKKQDLQVCFRLLIFFSSNYFECNF